MAALPDKSSVKTRQVRKATTQELAGMLEKIEVIQHGSQLELDNYGHPKNVRMVPDDAIVHSARLGLRQTYWNWGGSPEERHEAGEALGYTSFRIELHERTKPLRVALNSLSACLYKPYEKCVFGWGRDIINRQN